MPLHPQRRSELEMMLRACYREFGFIGHRDQDEGNEFVDALRQIVEGQKRTQEQLDRLEKLVMTTKAELQASMDATKAEVAHEKDLVAAIKLAQDGQTALISSLNDQIATLVAAGAGAVSQADLDALGQESADTLTVAQENSAAMAALAPTNTPAQNAPGATPAADAPPAPAATTDQPTQ